MTSNADTINTNAQGVRKASGDQGSAEMHSIGDQIKADKYASSKSAVRKRNPFAGMRFKCRPPGATGR